MLLKNLPRTTTNVFSPSRRASCRSPGTGRRGRLFPIEILEGRTLLSITYNAPIDLSTLGGASSWAAGINSNGQVVGTSNTGAFDKYGNPIDHAFVWDTTHGMRDLGTYGSDLNSFASGINSSGAVAGTSSTAPILKKDKFGNGYFVSTDHAVTWGASSSVQKLGVGDALGLNDARKVVGTSNSNAILWGGGKTINLGTLGGTGNPSAALGINTGGQVVGYSPTNDSSETQHAFLWTPTSPDGPSGTIIDLGTLDGAPGFPSAGVAVNASGEVVGWTADAAAGGNDHGFLYSGGKMYDLGTLTSVGGSYTPSEAHGINTPGTVVGYAGDPNNAGASTSRAWIWTPTSPGGTSGQLTDLNGLIPAGSGWVLNDAEAIDDAGQVVGRGMINGEEHAFLLNPATTTALAQPAALTATVSPLSPVHPMAAVSVASARVSVVAPEASGFGERSRPARATCRAAAPSVRQLIFDFALADLTGRPRSSKVVNDRTARPGPAGLPTS
jgi:probable HAF family extracellular repeat protein